MIFLFSDTTLLFIFAIIRKCRGYHQCSIPLTRCYFIAICLIYHQSYFCEYRKSCFVKYRKILYPTWSETWLMSVIWSIIPCIYQPMSCHRYALYLDHWPLPVLGRAAILLWGHIICHKEHKDCDLLSANMIILWNMKMCQKICLDIWLIVELSSSPHTHSLSHDSLSSISISIIVNSNQPTHWLF